MFNQNLIQARLSTLQHQICRRHVEYLVSELRLLALAQLAAASTADNHVFELCEAAALANDAADALERLAAERPANDNTPILN